MRKRISVYKILSVLILSATFLSCGKNQNKEGVFKLLDSSETGIRFTNTIENSPDFNIFNYRNFYNGGGVAAGDINNDGLPDLFFTANMGENRLYLNKGNFRFEDITQKAGIAESDKWSTGVVMADINADGLLDIYVCNAGRKTGASTENSLFINNGDLTFTEKAEEYGLNEDGYTTHAAFFDYDKDGDLDAYILNNSFIPVNTLNYANNRDLRAKDWPVKDFMKGGGDKLLRNDKGKYIDVSEESGIYGSLIGFGLGVTVGDLNNDNWPDLYVSNDFYEKDYLYINQKDGTFLEEIEERIGHTSLASMGADIADINQDGEPEIFVTDMLPATEQRLKTTASYENHYIHNLKLERGFYQQFMQNTLQLNNGDGSFSEIAQYAGVAKSDWSWGALLFDADNDGLSDIYVCNGILQDVIDQDFIDFFADELTQKMAVTGKKESIDKILEKMPSVPVVNAFFRNQGDLKFIDEATKFGFTQPSFSNGAAYADLDNDGDLDLVVNNINQEAFVYQNTSDKTNHYLKIKAKGEGQNTYAVGARVNVYHQNKVFSQQLIPSRGFQSSTDYIMTFGLGQAQRVDSVHIIWPNDKMTRLGSLKTDTLLQVDIKNSNGLWKPKNHTSANLFRSMDAGLEAHRENNFQDYYQEKNMPFRLSAEGPASVTGDLNADGIEDLVIAGGKDQLTKVYFGTANHTYKDIPQKALTQFIAFEDTALELFDADGDGDLDLYVGSGGNEYPEGSLQLMDRLFINNGKGEFETGRGKLPIKGFNTSVVKAHDVDNDGDLDLFVGTRNLPQSYGEAAPSFVFVNDGTGQFKDKSSEIAPELKDAGMITDAQWADINGDKQKELLLIGDWTTPQVFLNQKGKLTRLENTGLEKYSGFWSALQVSDIDADGDMDLLLGNLGENFAYQIDQSHPFKVYVNDFDKNNTRDKVFVKTIEGREMPVFLKRDITEQFPALKTSSLKHAEYAKKTVQDLFDKSLLNSARVLQVNTLKSLIAINDGNGHFTVKEMPKEMQFSCVNAMVEADINSDGIPDYILGGNSSQMIPQFGRLDACRGKVLLGDGKGSFEVIRNSGLNLTGEVRQIIPLSNKRILVLLNNESPKLFEY